MNDGISTLVKSIFQKESLHECSVEELQNLARQYPYFTPAQFLLAEKLKSVDDNLYKEQMQELSLHFNNPLWLDYLSNGYKSDIKLEHPTETIHSIGETTIGQAESPQVLGEEATFVESEPEVQVEEKAVEREEQDEDFADETPTEDEEHFDSSSTVEEMAVNSEPALEGSKQVEDTTIEVENVDNDSFHEIGIEEQQAKSVIEEIPINVETTSEIAQQVEARTSEPVSEDLRSSDLEEIKEKTEMPDEEDSQMDFDSKPDELREQKVFEPATSIHLPDLKQEPAETELTFEPYHTVDYFASQGIKFVPEDKPADRFSQQLKSFTEWLKTLKRLPESDTSKTADPGAEEKVQKLADHSISEDEVVTESMAEVWMKQGNKEKAIEIYHKLSLLNPAKSAYFASLIEQVKNS
jgi:hypothetical protein